MKIEFSPKVWAWIKFLLPGLAIIGALWFFASSDDNDPEPCQAAEDTPCLVGEQTVRLIDAAGAYQFESLDAWREGRAEYGEYVRDTFGEPGSGPYSP